MKSSYVFNAALASAALSGIASFGHKSDAVGATLAAFTFESTQAPFSVTGTGSGTGTNSTSTFLQYAASTGATVGPLTADSGTGSAYGVHAGASTVYSVPVGNGSSKSLSANNYAANDYFEFQVPTLGVVDNLLVSFDQVRSGTGPSTFSLIYGSSTGIGTAGDVVLGTIGTYAVPTGPSFAASASSTAVSFSFDLSSIQSQLALLPTAFFRLAVLSSSSATGGTSRVDNFVVSSVPEPTAMALSLVAAGGLLRRRRS